MIDLHTHSTFSDGSLTPEQLIREAEHQRLSAVALTDHDTTDGLDRFMAAAQDGIVRAVPGVEISVDCPSGTMHILGYLIDHNHPGIRDRLSDIRDGRVARNRHILKHLNDMGIALTMEEVAAYAGENNIGRLHFAQAMVARGYVKTRQAAFDSYLGKQGPAYHDRLRLSAADGIHMIRAAGGVAVLAHPFTLNMGRKALTALVAELHDHGLQGIEIYYPQQNNRLSKFYLGLARRFNLLVTGGTDFHGAPMPEIRMGRGFGELEIPDRLLAELDALHGATS